MTGFQLRDFSAWSKDLVKIKNICTSLCPYKIHPLLFERYLYVLAEEICTDNLKNSGKEYNCSFQQICNQLFLSTFCFHLSNDVIGYLFSKSSYNIDIIIRALVITMMSTMKKKNDIATADASSIKSLTHNTSFYEDNEIKKLELDDILPGLTKCVKNINLQCVPKSIDLFHVLTMNIKTLFYGSKNASNDFILQTFYNPDVLLKI